MARHLQLTFDAADPDALARFWAEVLGYILQPPPEGFESWDAWADAMGMPAEERDKYSAVIDPDDDTRRIFFQKVPEGKSAKNRMHLDVKVTERGMDLEEQRGVIEAEASRLVALGANRLDEHEEFGGAWRVMEDPEGNVFCLT